MSQGEKLRASNLIVVRDGEFTLFISYSQLTNVIGYADVFSNIF